MSFSLDLRYSWAVYAREVKRFCKLFLDTVLSPVVSMILYLAIFSVVAAGRAVQGISYPAFVYAGLLVMTMVNGSFANPAFALTLAKNLGTIFDIQIAPLKAWKIGLAYAAAALTRGLAAIAFAVLVTVWFVPGISLHNPLLLIVSLGITGMEFGMLGVIVGLWADGFERLQIVSIFILQPMIFLGGVFYPVTQLPAPWNTVSLFNPVHSNVNLIRAALTGYTDGSVAVSLAVTCGFAIILFFAMRALAERTLRVK